MTHAEQVVVTQILEIFAAKGIDPPEVNEKSPVDGSLGLESLDFAELAVRLEGEFGRDPFAEGDVPPLNSVADLAALYETPNA